MAFASLPKSTIVRMRNAGLRASFRVSEVVAPAAGARLARDLWFTAPPRHEPLPLPHGGEPFEVISQGVTVRGHVWGEGPVVYLVHGWGGRGSQLAAYVTPLVSAGHRVVMFDAPSHGDSDPGAAGGNRSSGVEFGKALDAVFVKYGPAHAVIAHSMGALATYLALRFGWLGARRLVFLAPMVEINGLYGMFQDALGLGPRSRRALDRAVREFVGFPARDFDARVQAAAVDPLPTLVIHDTGDPQTPYADAVSLVESLPGARLVTTTGLGHRRILRDPAVMAEVLSFLRDDEPAAGVA